MTMCDMKYPNDGRYMPGDMGLEVDWVRHVEKNNEVLKQTRYSDRL